jgi:hypothetical protein
VQTFGHRARAEDVGHRLGGAAEDHGGRDAGEELADEEQDAPGAVDAHAMPAVLRSTDGSRPHILRKLASSRGFLPDLPS